MIEYVSQENLDDILPLVRQYQEFYKVVDICDQKNREFFSQFGEHSNKGCQFLYRKNTQAVAFASVYFSFASTLATKVAVLNDVYTIPSARGQGIARELIEHCRVFASENGAARLQWVTAPDNTVAQALYDAMDTNKSTWHFYTYSV